MATFKEGLLEAADQDLDKGPEVQLRLELKAYPEKPDCCLLCDTTSIASHGRPNIRIRDMDTSIFEDKKAFREKLLDVNLTLDQRWDMITSPLVRRFRCSPYGHTFRTGPYVEVAQWAQPIITATYIFTDTVKDAKSHLESFFGQGIAYATAYRQALGIMDETSYNPNLTETVARRHIANRGKVSFITGYWDEDLPIAWWLRVRGEIVGDSLNLLNQLVQISQQNPRMGTLSYIALEGNDNPN